MFRLLPNGFANRDLRGVLAELLGRAAITAGQMSYDLWRLRAHGLITRIPRSHRDRFTDTGLHHACCSTTSTSGCCCRPGPTHRPRPARAQLLAHRARNFRQALDQLTQEAGLGMTIET